MSENIIWDLLKEEFVESYLQEHLQVDLKLKSINAFKKQIWHTTYHVVFRYIVEIASEEKHIFVTAHDHEMRENVLFSLKYLVSRGFGAGEFLVPEPLFFDQKYNAAFYYGMIGNNLYYYIKENRRADLDRLLEKTAMWFVKLHNLDTKTGLDLNIEHGRIKTISPGVDNILSLVKERYPHYSETFAALYKYFITAEEYGMQTITSTLIHGDAHPENIIKLNSEQIGVIDFVDMTLGDPMRDVGSFLQQLEYMGTRKIGDVKYVESVKNIFLTSYLKHAKIELTPEVQERIDIYYDWTCIRTATFFLMKHDPEPDRADPLIAEVLARIGHKL